MTSKSHPANTLPGSTSSERVGQQRSTEKLPPSPTTGAGAPTSKDEEIYNRLVKVPFKDGSHPGTAAEPMLPAGHRGGVGSHEGETGSDVDMQPVRIWGIPSSGPSGHGGPASGPERVAIDGLIGCPFCRRQLLRQHTGKYPPHSPSGLTGDRRTCAGSLLDPEA